MKNSELTDKEFLYSVAIFLENIGLDESTEYANKRLRLIARNIPLTQTTLTEEDVSLNKKDENSE